ncbi:response regulator [Sphingomonas sp. LH128]
MSSVCRIAQAMREPVAHVRLHSVSDPGKHCRGERRTETHRLGQRIHEAPCIVLIVEDEPLIRMMAEDMVMDAGLIPLCAADAHQALRILADHDDIAILFTDVDLPGDFNGLDLARRVHASGLGLDIIITTGRCEPDESLLPTGAQFLAKPYSGAELLNAIHTAEC